MSERIWFPHFNGLYFTIDVGPGEYDPAVAHVYLNQVLRTSKDDAEAIARLISAAPELLECLKDTRRLLTDQDAIDLVHIDAVIAKAEGTVSRAEVTS